MFQDLARAGAREKGFSHLPGAKGKAKGRGKGRAITSPPRIGRDGAKAQDAFLVITPMHPLTTDDASVVKQGLDNPIDCILPPHCSPPPPCIFSVCSESPTWKM